MLTVELVHVHSHFVYDKMCFVWIDICTKNIALWSLYCKLLVLMFQSLQHFSRNRENAEHQNSSAEVICTVLGLICMFQEV